MMNSCLRPLVIILGTALGYQDAFSSKCGPGWTQTGNKCFKLMAAPNTWTVLEKACAHEGSRLASIATPAENEAIRRLAAGQTIYIGGLSYALGPWTWADLTPFGAYRNWANGHQPTPSPYKPCIKMNPTGQWFDNCCRVPPAPGVCEKYV